MSHHNQAVFVVFEGLDGSGKSACAQRTAEVLGAHYMTTPSGPLRANREQIVESFNGCQEAAHLMYLASVASASQSIGRLMSEGTSVVLDRYFLSTQVYAAFRGSTLGGDKSVARLLQPATLTVYLDAPLSVRRDRVQRRSSVVSLADAETLSEQADQALREGYRTRFDLPINRDVLTLDSSQFGVDEIAEAVLAQLQRVTGELQ